MGRATPERVDAVLLGKVKLLVSSALERAAKDLPGGKRAFHHFVEDLDIYDSFSRRIFELLVKETIQRRPRATHQSCDLERDTELIEEIQVEEVPGPSTATVGGDASVASVRARRYEARLPYISDLSGVPAPPHRPTLPPVADRASSPSMLARLQNQRDAQARATATHHVIMPPALHRGSFSDARAPTDYLMMPPNEQHRVRHGPAGDIDIIRSMDAVPMEMSLSGASSDPPAAFPLTPPPVQSHHHQPGTPPPPAANLLSLTGPGAISRSETPLVAPMEPRSDFEAFASRRRDRHRQRQHPEYEMLRSTPDDDGSDGEDIYERLGSSSSVAALAGLEYAHATWHHEDGRTQHHGSLPDGDLQRTLAEFLAEGDSDAGRTTRVRRRPRR